jgi:hypothetical protein
MHLQEREQEEAVRKKQGTACQQRCSQRACVCAGLGFASGWIRAQRKATIGAEVRDPLYNYCSTV